LADYRCNRLGSTDGSEGTEVTDHGLTPIRSIDGGATLTGLHRRDDALQPFPSEPPAALTAEYQAAARVIEDMAAKQVNLHFEIDDDSNKVRVQMLDKNGDVIREIPARSLLDSLSGGGLLIDERG
jgi:hypothetical protein